MGYGRSSPCSSPDTPAMFMGFVLDLLSCPNPTAPQSARPHMTRFPSFLQGFLMELRHVVGVSE